MTSTFSDWTKDRTLISVGTNRGAPELAFQRWRHFKEAFAPELVARAVTEAPRPVTRCIDPFGGSGTTALACQFLGVEPITIEVNPFLADLIRAKLVAYDPDEIARDLGRVIKLASGFRGKATLAIPEGAPRTLVEPGAKGRWIFDTAVATRLGALIKAINQLVLDRNRLLFKVLLGGILVEVSNVVVNGKGRRYRRRWRDRPRDPRSVDWLFAEAVKQSLGDISQFGNRLCMKSTVINGDARTAIRGLSLCDLAVFSPPYPNSFDYTDVYNLELWTLGYLNERIANHALRTSTLCSHVQIDRCFPEPPTTSPTLTKALQDLNSVASDLWDRRLGPMVGGYFADLLRVLSEIRAVLKEDSSAWLVVGDSRYSGILIPTARILEELAPEARFEPALVEDIRSMRSSAQQGGKHELNESLIVLKPLKGVA